MVMDRSDLPYWGNVYAGLWRPRPLVQPSAEDIRFFEASAHRADELGDLSGVRALLLGVTRPIAAMRWPKDAQLVALDWSEVVIRRFWSPADAASVVLGDWREMPIAPATRNIVLADGCYHVLSCAEDGALLTREVRRVLRPGSFFCSRNFLRPDPPERVDDLFDELFAGHVRSLHVFRWRLVAALQGASGEGVPRDSVWKAWNARVKAPQALIDRYGDSDGGFRAIEAYRGRAARLYYFSLAELERLCSASFDAIECEIPGYEMGAHFPRLLMRARG